jgi:hypothetical protein
MKLSRLLILSSVLAAAPLAQAEVVLPSLGPDAVLVLDVVEAEDGAASYLVTSGDIFRSGDGGDFWIEQAVLEGYADLAWGGGTSYAVDLDLITRADDSLWAPEEVIDLPAGIFRGLRLSADSSSLYMIAADAAGDTSLWGLVHGTETWLALGGGLPADPLLDVMATSGGILVATANQGIWFSDDGGVNFDDTDQPDVVLVDWESDATGSVILLTDGTDLYRNTASGEGAWDTSDLGGAEVITSVGIANDGELLAGTDRSGLFSSNAWPNFTDDRADGRLSSVLGNVPVAIGAMGRASGTLLVGTLGRGVFIDHGLTATFIQPALKPNGGEVLSFATGRDQNESVLGTRGGGVFLTTDSGGEWAATNANFNARDVHALVVDGEVVYAGTDGGVRRAASIASLQWEEVGAATLSDVTVSALMLVDTRLVAATENGIYYSDDQGDTWTLGNAAVTEYLADDGTALWAAGPGVFMTSTDAGASWSVAGTSGVVGTPRRVFVAGGDVWLAVSDGLYRSADQAASWSAVDTQITPATATADYLLVFSDNKDDLYVAEATGGFRVSFDDGLRWRDLYRDIPVASGGTLAGIRAYSEVIAEPLEEGGDPPKATLHFGMGNYGMFGSTVADPGDTNFLVHPGGGLVSIALDDGNIESITVTGIHPDRANAPPGVLFSLGFYSFTLSGIEPGQAVELTLSFSLGASPDRFYKYGPTADDAEDHWYEFLFDGTTGAEFDAEVITLHFVDGGFGDSDGEVNGVIVDPAAPGYFVGEDSGGGVPGPLLLGALVVLIARRVYSAR